MCLWCSHGRFGTLVCGQWFPRCKTSLCFFIDSGLCISFPGSCSHVPKSLVLLVQCCQESCILNLVWQRSDKQPNACNILLWCRHNFLMMAPHTCSSENIRCGEWTFVCRQMLGKECLSWLPRHWTVEHVTRNPC